MNDLAVPEPREPDPGKSIRPAALVLPAVAEPPLTERRPWLERTAIVDAFSITGVKTPVYLTAAGVAITTTGIGKSDAATTVTALLASSEIDLSAAYVVSAGIAGGPPERIALGSVAIADAVVDWDRKHRWDRATDGNHETQADHEAQADHTVRPEPNEGSDDPDAGLDLLAYRPHDYVHDLEDALVNAACEAATDVSLRTDADAQAYQDRYPGAPEAGPAVERGPTVCGDEFWHGPRYAREVEWLCDAYGVSPYLTTQMEDAATATALERFDLRDRYLSVRAVANYDRAAPGQSVEESFDGNEASLALALDNAARVGGAIVDDLVESDPLEIRPENGV
ncbi:purine nucleoside permease domain protein [Natrialba magadii ATCC 43099]|uniref:Purine nucleoside permease n=1 Tax=Natrialba magadii (strain ATCC 43099 / DSM 3394 / CCM 3739 / CIP 104546 / IAM 13178 / JCM 8861 / NBRC 102185 / NCIMB 2190 / MS3) TaxID=547559 RepID=D3SZV8_NATMM|nr:phosphorylase [Natrialba magadii]ADD06368.1 purine nucleoside permease domain protein [Natrialba magadii ATCC 43099]ELY31489.1 purine nucleoside permease [Natrialba magadii ATCC 43099]